MAIFIGEVELKVPEPNSDNERTQPHPHHFRHQHDHHGPRPTRQHHLQANEHPQLQDLPIPSDQVDQTGSTESPTGSPKMAFSAGLPSRIRSGEFNQPFNLHSQQAGLSEEECAMLRQVDIERILTSIRILGYDVPMRPGVLNGPIVTFFHEQTNPVHRLEALIGTIQAEFTNIMIAIKRPRSAVSGDLGIDRSNEQALTQLVAGFIPHLAELSARVGGQVSESLRAHQAEVRLNVKSMPERGT